MGVEVGDLGSHSARRKGVTSMVTAGIIAAPPYMSVTLRIGWSLGSVQVRYLKDDRAGDIVELL